jgi:N-acetylneuraminic acid mutarotase
VVGGSPPTLPVPNQKPYTFLEIFDPRTGRWTLGPGMPTARHHLATAVLDGKLYVLGGRQPGDFSLTAFERFDPETGEWAELPALPEGAGGLAAASAGGLIIATGGGDDGEGWVTPATWAFDPDAARWRRLADLSVARHGHAAAAVGRRVFAIGGSPCPGFGNTPSIESLTVR